MHLLFEPCLPFKHGIIVICLIRALFRSQKTNANDIAKNDLQRLTVFLIHGKQKCREHDEDHCHRRYAGSGYVFEQKEKRYSHEESAAKANELSFCEIEKHLGLDFGQVLGNIDIRHDSHLR